MDIKELKDLVMKKYATPINEEALENYIDNLSFEEIDSITDICQIHEKLQKYLDNLLEQKYDYTPGENKELIHTDENYKDILNKAYELKNNNESIEKISYFVAYKLALLVKENPVTYIYPHNKEKLQQSVYTVINKENEYKGVCHNISKLYCDFLEELGIKSDLIIEQIDNFEQTYHLDALVYGKDDNRFMVNVIGMIYRAKTNRTISAKQFGGTRNERYKKRVEAEFGRLEEISQEDKEKWDKEFGFLNGEYFNKKIDEFLNKQYDENKNMKYDYETYIKLFKEYIEFIQKNETFSENISFKEKEAHYTVLMSKFMREYKSTPIITNLKTYNIVVKDKQGNFGKIFMLEPGSKDKKEKIYYGFNDNNNIQEISEEKILENLVQGNIRPVSNREREGKLRKMFGDEGYNVIQQDGEER